MSALETGIPAAAAFLTAGRGARRRLNPVTVGPPRYLGDSVSAIGSERRQFCTKASLGAQN